MLTGSRPSPTGDPQWRCAGATIIPVKVSGETFSILDLIAALYYVGRLREIGEITRGLARCISSSHFRRCDRLIQEEQAAVAACIF